MGLDCGVMDELPQHEEPWGSLSGRGGRYRRSVPLSPSDATRKPLSHRRLMELKAPDGQREAHKRASQPRASVQARLIERSAQPQPRARVLQVLTGGKGAGKWRIYGPGDITLTITFPEASLADAGHFRGHPL